MIYVMHENREWCVPLFEQLDALGVPYADWNLAEGVVPYSSQPPEGVFYNRISASSHTRGNLHSPELALATLYWLDKYGRRVINGHRAVQLEVSKVAQYHAIERAGGRVPATAAFVGKTALLDGIQRAPMPCILKPNRGGKGWGVSKFDTAAEATDYIQQLAPEAAPIDGIWLLQQYIQAAEPYITRCELVNGAFLYAVRVGTTGGFELCPADHCEVPSAGEPNFEIVSDFREPDLIAMYQRVMQENQVNIAAFEFIRDVSGEIYTYDLNTNTNYNSRAEQAAQLSVGGMGKIAQYLASELKSVAGAKNS